MAYKLSLLVFVLGLSQLVLALPTTVRETKPNPEEEGSHFEGDILSFPPEVFMKSGIVGNNYRWPNAVVPYTIHFKFSKQDKNLILQAIAHLEANTCVRFVERTTEKDFVLIDYGKPNSGFFSSVGKIVGGQVVNLTPPLVEYGRFGTVVHEIIHALGFFHEQSRTDRDDYVRINWDNIPTKAQNNYAKYTPTTSNGQGVTYDYGSIMHYSAYGFAIDPSIPTIITPRGVQIGQREQLSPKDIQKINNMYCKST